MGSVRLKVKPSNGRGLCRRLLRRHRGRASTTAFQKLSIALGTHRIEISAPGYQPLVFEIDVQDFDTITYEGRLEPIK